MVTEFSQWLSAMESQDFTLINPMDKGMIDSAVEVLEPRSSELILQGILHNLLLLIYHLTLRNSTNMG